MSYGANHLVDFNIVQFCKDVRAALGGKRAPGKLEIELGCNRANFWRWEHGQGSPCGTMLVAMAALADLDPTAYIIWRTPNAGQERAVCPGDREDISGGTVEGMAGDPPGGEHLHQVDC